jgi:hypothetical protein
MVFFRFLLLWRTEFNNRAQLLGLEDEISWTKDETSQLEDVVREKTAQIAALVGGLDALQVT